MVYICIYKPRNWSYPTFWEEISGCINWRFEAITNMATDAGPNLEVGINHKFRFQMTIEELTLALP